MRIAILSLIFSTLIREFMAFLERNNSTPPNAALTEFLVAEEIRRKFSYSDSFAILSLCIVRCFCRHITSNLNFEMRVASSSFLESFSTERVLKVLVKKGHFLLINLSASLFAVSELVLPHGFGHGGWYWRPCRLLKLRIGQEL